MDPNAYGLSPKRFEGDASLLAEVIDIFSSSSPGLIQEVRDAITRADAGALERSAHTLKGAIGNFSAASAFEAARRLESLGAEGRLEKAAEARLTLEREVERLRRALATLIAGHAA